MQTPVLLLFFNRPKHAAAVLDRLRAVRPARVYVHIDGPRADRPGEAEQVDACRAMLKQIDWPCQVETLVRPVNKGLRDGVFDAINWFFEAEEAGIIVEDDCLPDPTFFGFCEELLQKYREDERVMHIAGSNMAAPAMPGVTDSYFGSGFSLVWGWASWRRAWAKMKIGLEGLEQFPDSPAWQSFAVSGMAKTYLLDKFRATARGENNSWAYAWFYSILQANGICLVPVRNMVENVGVGEDTATHTKNRLSHLQIQASAMEFPLKHPQNLEPRRDLDQLLFDFTQKRPLRLKIWYLLHLFGLR